VFLTIVFILISLDLIVGVCDLYPDDIEQDLCKISHAAAVLYVIEWQLCMAILFARVVYIFRGSTFALSKCAIIAISIVIFCSPALPFSTIILFYAEKPIITILMGLASFVVFACLLIFLNGVFVHKLVCMCRNVDNRNNDDNEMLDVINKVVVLTFTSSITALVSYICLVIRVIFSSSAVAYFVFVIAWHIDIVSNVMSVVLATAALRSWYYRLCCHEKSKQCVRRMVQGKDATRTNMMDSGKERSALLTPANGP